VLALAGVGAALTGVVVALIVGYLVGHETGPTKTTTETIAARAAAPGGEAVGDIVPAPAFSAEELAADPRENWITNGGSLSNARYSPLDEIDTENVADLKGVWMTHLNGSGEATKYSAEAQPIVYQGVMYVVTGADDVFAVDVETGKKLWVYEAKLPEAIDTVCCGWTNRGVALGEGMVFLGQLDGTLVALDQQTGAVKWKAAIGKWQNGETITSAPLYYNGRVYSGLSGGEFGIRGRLTALDAKTGKVDWKFWTIPGPGEEGHETWEGGEAWKKGGAPVWNTPAVDPELNMLYFSTGNASPDLNGSGRPGENLFAASIVALDATTGKYKWHFQEVHHDIWDYDAPSPVVLWNAEVDGEEVKGLSQPGKTGWLYMINRETGKPVHGIVEKKVPQDKEQQATWPTQPYPLTESFVPHEVSEGDFEEIKKLAEASFEGKKLKIEQGDVFDPFNRNAKVLAPGPSGGTNWPPSSYNRNTGDVYICGISSYAGYMTEGAESHTGAGDLYLSSVFTLTGFGTYDGTLTAQDVNTGEIEWQREFEGESCYSGTVTTAGNLVFVGRSNGELTALDAETGDELWSFQTGAGANTTPTVFEWEGKEYLAFYAGGNSLAASAHGDNLWLFSLEGEMEELESGGKGEQGQHAGEETPQVEVEESEGSPEEAAGGGGEGKENVEEESAGGDAAAGKMVFSENCSVCHGPTGAGGNGGPSLKTSPIAKSLNGTAEQVTEGGGGMPAFAEVLSTSEIEDVAAYVVESINK
jgi:alcohol dehydrogenase (cytochrome c)